MAGCVGAGRRVLVEYVSANPTGPLHVGRGGAAVGRAVVRFWMRSDTMPSASTISTTQVAR